MGIHLRILLVVLCFCCWLTPARAETTQWHKIAFDKVHIVSLTADPVRPSTLYAVTSDGLVRSVDAGVSWAPLGGVLPDNIPPACVAVNPHNSKEIYVGYDGMGIFKSVDAGNTWQSVNEGLPNRYIRCIVVSPKDSNLLYIGIQGGVAVTTNGGRLWHMSSGFKRAINVNAIVIDPKNPQYLYAATGGAGVYKSGNGGVSWRDINDGLSSLSILALHVDPENPDIVLAGAYHPATPTDLYVGEANGGTFRSTDGGRTWQETGLLNITIFSYAASLDYPGVVYAGAWGGAYRSINKGETWTDMNAGLDNAFLHKVHVLPGRPPVILGGTTYGLLSYTDVELDTLHPKGSTMKNQMWYFSGGGAVVFAFIALFLLRRRTVKQSRGKEKSVW